MSIRSTPARWGLAARVLHGAMALAIVAMLVLGVVMTNYPLSIEKLRLYALHKSIGITLLALVAVRLGWRLWDARPEWPPGTQALERRAARIAHASMYVLMVCVPLSGWLVNSASGFPLNWFGLAAVPAISGPDETLQARAELAHLVLTSTLGLLLVLHVAAALRHHFKLRDGLLRRMWF